MRHANFVIAAGSTVTHRDKGRYFRIISTTQNLNVTTDKGDVRLTDVGDDEGFRGFDFREVMLTNPSGTDATVKIVVGNEGELLEPMRVAGAVQIAVGDDYTTSSDSSVTSTPETVTLPANCIGAVFTAAAGNSQTVYVAGIPLQPGQATPVPLADKAVTYSADSGTQTIYWTIYTRN